MTTLLVDPVSVQILPTIFNVVLNSFIVELEAGRAVQDWSTVVRDDGEILQFRL